MRYDFVDDRLAQALADLAAVVLLVEDHCAEGVDVAT
jgi:hypothetical protein